MPSVFYLLSTFVTLFLLQVISVSAVLCLWAVTVRLALAPAHQIPVFMVEPVCHVEMTSTASAEASTPDSGERAHTHTRT